MKKSVFFIILLFSVCFLNPVDAKSNHRQSTYYDLFLTMIYPTIDQAIQDYYEDILTIKPREDVFSIKVLNIERKESYDFIIKFEVTPFIGPHNSIGKDHITIEVKLNEQPKVIKYDHLESYPIIKDYLKKNNE